VLILPVIWLVLPEETDGAIPVRASVLPADQPAAIPAGPAGRSTYKALISIGGMTCSVCSGTVTETSSQ
jgi:hypothetical protein